MLEHICKDTQIRQNMLKPYTSSPTTGRSSNPRIWYWASCLSTGALRDALMGKFLQGVVRQTLILAGMPLDPVIGVALAKMSHMVYTAAPFHLPVAAYPGHDLSSCNPQP